MVYLGFVIFFHIFFRPDVFFPCLKIISHMIISFLNLSFWMSFLLVIFNLCFIFPLLRISQFFQAFKVVGVSQIQISMASQVYFCFCLHFLVSKVFRFFMVLLVFLIFQASHVSLFSFINLLKNLGFPLEVSLLKSKVLTEEFSWSTFIVVRNPKMRAKQRFWLLSLPN